MAASSAFWGFAANKKHNIIIRVCARSRVWDVYGNVIRFVVRSLLYRFQIAAAFNEHVLSIFDFFTLLPVYGRLKNSADLENQILPVEVPIAFTDSETVS